MSGRVALVTGITGQDGSYLSERLVREGFEVHGVVAATDAAARDAPVRFPDVVLHQADLRNFDELERAVRVASPDVVVNLAGISSVALSWQQPVLTGDVSGLGAARLLELAWQQQERSGRPVRFVQASSAEIFGQPAQSPQDERTPVRPASPYGAAKAYAHGLVAVYRNRGLAACSLVLYNHESPRRPPSFVTRKITLAAARIALGQQTELVLGNLDARRDWGWAPDYVDAMIRAMDRPADDYVIATGRAHSVREFAAAAFERAGVADWERRVSVAGHLVRPADPVLLVGDAAHARDRLGWAPTVGFRELVGRMVDSDLRLVQRDATATGDGSAPDPGSALAPGSDPDQG